jgi:hypothetical protein
MASEQNNSYCEIEVDDEITFRAPIKQSIDVPAEIDGKENTENITECEPTSVVSKAAAPEPLAPSKMPTNLRSSWDLPSSITSQYSSKPLTSFTDAPAISNIRSRSSWEDEPETSSKKPTVSKQSWELPSNLTRAYGNNNEHIAKYSEAEHQTLLGAAVSAANSEHEKKVQVLEVEWSAEKQTLEARILQLEKKATDSAGSNQKSEELIQEAQQEAMLSKMQTKALTHRVQVGLPCVFLFIVALAHISICFADVGS